MKKTRVQPFQRALPAQMMSTQISSQASTPFSFKGAEQSAAGCIAAVGSFTADGPGSITGGTLDLNSSRLGHQTIAVKGTYTLNGGKGVVTLDIPLGVEHGLHFHQSQLVACERCRERQPDLHRRRPARKRLDAYYDRFPQPTYFVGYAVDQTHFLTISLDSYRQFFLMDGEAMR